MKLKFNEVKYTYRFNKGNYESEEIGISAFIEEGNFQDALLECKSLVHGKAVVAAAPVNKEVKKAPVKAKEVEAKVEKEVEAKVESPKKEAAKKAPVKKAAAKKAPAKRKTKAVAYDRTVDGHKARMAELCLDVFGEGWRKDRSILGKIKQASGNLVGEDFLGEDGEILESFVAEFKKQVE